MKTIILAAAFAVLFATAGMAQTDQGQSDHRVNDLKGPPNANGFTKNGTQNQAPNVVEAPPSAENMKGPPNANGFHKQ